MFAVGASVSDEARDVGGGVVRLDKWLWAARLFKTRSLAAEAAAGGKVHLNGARVKPAKAVRPGDELRVRRGEHEIVVIVRALALQRRPAPEAAALYEETDESKAARERHKAAMRGYVGEPAAAGRPTKKARRDARRLTRGS